MTAPAVVAIDGPAASGKSSTAARVAAELGLPHVDSGALYRALTWLAVDRGLRNASDITAAAELVALHLALREGTLAVVLDDDDRDLDEVIRSPAVNASVSAVAALPAVREWANHRLRDAALMAGAVMDGRDIGTVVFPDARLKVFLTATPEARARRRLMQRGDQPAVGELEAESARLAERDRLDASRAVAPLRQADDAILVDTTNMGFDEQVERIVALARDRGLQGA